MTGEGGRGRLALGSGLLFLVGGLGLQAVALLSGGWPTLFPLGIALLGVPPLVLGLLARKATPAGSPGPFLLRHADAVAALFLAAAILAAFLSMGVEREERYETYWSYDLDGEGRPDRRRILLEFVDYPGWVSRINSSDLGPYLESRGSERVPVIFLVTRDFGRARGFIEVQVGDRRDWKDLGGGGFQRRTTPHLKGEIGPSPFR